MKDSTKSNLQTPKKEGFTRYDKTPTIIKNSTPISEKKITPIIHNEGGGIFKSPMRMNGLNIAAGQTSHGSPTYQCLDKSPFPPMSFPYDYHIENHFISPQKKEYKHLIQPMTQYQSSAFPFKFASYSNPSSPFQEKQIQNQVEYVQNPYFQQLEEINHQDHQDESNIETNLIFSEQNGATLLACETLNKQIQLESTNNAGTIILKKPKFIIEFKNSEELQHFKNSDEFKQLKSKLDFSQNYFEFDVPQSSERNINGKTIYNTTNPLPKKSTSAQRVPHLYSNGYMSPNKKFHRQQYLMRPNPQYPYGMNPYYYGFDPSQAMSNSPNFKGHFYKSVNNDNRVVNKIYTNNTFAPFPSQTPNDQQKKVGKILFDNAIEKGVFNDQNDNKSENEQESTQKPKKYFPQVKSEAKADTEQEQNDQKLLLKESELHSDMIYDNNTISIPLDDEQKKILKEKHKKIHNKPNSTFLEQQIQSIEQNKSKGLDRQTSLKSNSQEINEDIEEVDVKNPIFSAVKKNNKVNGALKEEIESEQSEDKVDQNINSLSTAKKIRSLSKNDITSQDSINKKRRHFDTPNIKRNEFSTPSTKKKHDLQLSKSRQGNYTLNSKCSTSKNIDPSIQGSTNISRPSSQHQFKGRINKQVSDFANELTSTKNQNEYNISEEDFSHSHSHNCEEFHKLNELEDIEMMAEDEDLRDPRDEEDEDEEHYNLEDLDESDKKECCGCKKTKCLKLYCECFQAMKYCVGNNCQGCLNKPQYEDLRKQAMDSIQQRNSSAFEPKADTNEQLYKSASGSKATHSKGCNCKKSDCRKKYCECYQMGAKCTHLCKCFNCKNRHDSNSHSFSGSKQGMPILPHYMDTVSPHMHPPPPPHFLPVPPHRMPFRGSSQGHMMFQYPQMYHPHQSQGYGAYDNWNYYHTAEYNYSRQGDFNNNGLPSQQQQEYDNTPKFNSIKRQQQAQLKSANPVKDFSSADKD